MLTEIEPYEDRRARAWNHKLQLDSLPTFSLKLKYCLENIDSYPHDTIYQDGENAPFTLGIEPETANDRRELHQVWMEHHRKEFINKNASVDKLRWSETNKKEVAYYIQSVETLKSDLESRLSTATRKHDLLETELDKVTSTIDSVDKNVNGTPSTLASEIKELRFSLETNSPYDFAFLNENFPGDKAVRLAEVWDILCYENYLKNRLAGLQIGQDTSTSLPNDEQINLTHSQIAILYHYNCQPITRNNAKDIAKKYGQTSGQRLETTYKDLTSALVRAGKGKNRVKDIEAVLPLLTGTCKDMAEKELEAARANNRK